MRSGGFVRLIASAAVCVLVSGCESGIQLNEVLNSNGGGGLRPTGERPPRQMLKADHGSGMQNGLLSDIETSRERFQETEVRGSGEFVATRVPYQESKTFKGENGITLNLVNVPINEAAKTILGDILKLQYSVDEKVAGSVTIQTTTPAPPEALIGVFEAVLKVQGAVIVSNSGFYSIVPSSGLAQLGTPLARSARGDLPGVQAHVVPLQHVSASEMKRILESVAPQGTVLRADDARSLLVLAGNTRELIEVARSIRTFDVDWMRGMSVGFYPVKSSDPEAVATELKTVFGLDKGGPLQGVVRILPNHRLGSVLVISSQPAHLDTARNWIERLDKAAQESEKQLFVYQIQNRPAGELAALLQRVLSTDREPGGLQQGEVAPRFDEAASAIPAAPLGGGPLSPGGNGNGLTEPAILNAPAAVPQPEQSSGQIQQTKSFQAGQTKVVADEANNALLIEALPKQYERISRILARLDVQPIQVMLEAVIAEVSLNDELRFGVKWYFEKKKSQFTFSDAINGVVASQFPGFSYLFAIQDVRVAIDALSGITNVKVVSAPSLMVMDNRRATLQIGDQVPIVTQTAQSVTDPNAPIVNAVTLRDTGVILSVTPRVNESGRVVLDVEQEVSNVTRTTTSGIDSPTIQQRKVKTAVSVMDGEVVALGGLIQQRDTQTKTQIPILGNLPVIGGAFREKESGIDRTELVIFLRPLVVRDDDEARQVTDEFQSRINIDEMSRTRGNRHYGRDANRILR